MDTWDTGLHEEVERIAIEAVNKWGKRLYDKQIFNAWRNKALPVRVEDGHKVELSYKNLKITAKVEFNDVIYELKFRRNFDEWIYDVPFTVSNKPENHVINLL